MCWSHEFKTLVSLVFHAIGTSLVCGVFMIAQLAFTTLSLFCSQHLKCFMVSHLNSTSLLWCTWTLQHFHGFPLGVYIAFMVFPLVSTALSWFCTWSLQCLHGFKLGIQSTFMTLFGVPKHVWEFKLNSLPWLTLSVPPFLTT